jgi:hypothetical protein
MDKPNTHHNANSDFNFAGESRKRDPDLPDTADANDYWFALALVFAAIVVAVILLRIVDYETRLAATDTAAQSASLELPVHAHVEGVDP